jgi:glycosyltransferase involved in cell wall biosynthesis
MPTLTVLIHTKNEEKNIKACITSVSSIADEILLVDMMSDDGTVAIAEKNGAKVLRYKTDHGFADPARDFALTKVKTDWVLILDADERIEAAFARTIQKLIEADQADVYYLPRKNIIFGTWIQHTGWWPDYQPRLFKKGHLQWPGKVHAQPVVEGRVEHLPLSRENAIVHYNYESISHFLEKLNRYTSITAQAAPLQAKEKPISSTQVFDTFFSEFLRRYFAQDGIKDGVHGASLSLLQAQYEVTTFLKKWELGKYSTVNVDQESGIRQLRKTQKEMNYWIAHYYVTKSEGLLQLYWKIRRKLSL